MRVVCDKNGNYLRTENVTAPPPASGLYCARDERGVPVSEGARNHEQQLASEQPAILKKQPRRADREKPALPKTEGEAAATTEKPKE